jgi:porphobilinogen synthase
MNTPPMAGYPALRLRRLRQFAWSRQLVQEHTLTPADLILPLFITEGPTPTTPITAMPGVYRHSVANAVEQARQAAQLGIPVVALFPHIEPHLKTEEGQLAYQPDNLVCRAVAAIKTAVPHIGIMCDVALDPYTTHGHDGVLVNGTVDNDETLAHLAQQALNQAQAGCDIIAPSDMMDGRIGVIRQALDAAGFDHVLILAYAVKYASAFYGPFRSALGSASNLQKANKRTYQMDPANALEGLHEAALDVAEGADMLMIKPGLPYLDMVYRIKQQFGKPTLAYHVSGEYAMLQAAAAQGWLNYPDTLLETLLAFKRAGANAIVTYGAMDAAKLLQQMPQEPTA